MQISGFKSVKMIDFDVISSSFIIPAFFRNHSAHYVEQKETEKDTASVTAQESRTLEKE